MQKLILKAPKIFLTGFMGSGKTTIGGMLAQRIGYAFLDIDEVIERRTGKTIPDIFRQNGEPFFRILEKEVLAECFQENSIVVSLGGGTLLDPVNITAIKENGLLIHLSAEPEEIWARVRDTDKRPLLLTSEGILFSDRNALLRIETLLAVRRHGYGFADLEIHTDHKTPEEILSIILNFIAGNDIEVI